jgi:signal transduction histidine kinase/DNA-binding NarL/FixJ family response regulator
MEKDTINTRVLIIDDEEIVRDNIEEILIPKRIPQNELISNASSILFGEIEVDEKIINSSSNGNIPSFLVDKATNGMEGVEMIKTSIKENNPYAVIFLDMRMPGWDGLETATHIREVDTKVEIIIVTAYSDRSIEEIVEKLGQNVGYHCKPYASEEILQIATKAVNDYNKLRNLEKLISVVSNISISETHLGSLLQNILDQLAMYIGSDVAVIGKILDTNEYQQLFSIGSVENKINIDKISSIISAEKINQEEVVQINELIFVKLQDYSIFALLNKNQKLKTEKLYLLKLFVQNAAKAIDNVQLNEALLQKEKLSAVGKAMSMLMHDLRSPIKNIKHFTSFIRSEGYNSKWLEMIDVCGEQASEIFDDFLDFIRESPLNTQPVSVSQLVKEGIELANNRSELTEIDITENIEEGLLVQGDNSKLKRVIMNLVSNAVEVLKNKKVKEPQIHISAHKLNDKVIIMVKDNGPGIPASIKDTLFDAFITTEKSSGTGLGLAIVKQFIIAHKGTITVENNNGANFTIMLPIAF